MYQTPYDTTVGSAIQISKVTPLLKQLLIRTQISGNSLVSLSEMPTALFLTGYYTEENEVPLFSNPVLVEGLNKKQYLFTDLRPFVGSNSNEHDNATDAIKVRSLLEYNAAISKAILTQGWLNNQQERYLTNLGFAGVVFAAAIAEAIRTRFSLDPLVQLRLMVVLHIFYQQLHYSKEELSSGEHTDKIALRTISQLSINHNEVFAIIDQVGVMTNITDLIEAIKKVSESPRLASFNTGLFMTVVMSMWYGYNAAEVIGVGVEYPPIWMSVVFAAATDKTVKNSMLAKTIGRIDKRGIAGTFVRSFVDEIKEKRSA